MFSVHHVKLVWWFQFLPLGSITQFVDEPKTIWLNPPAWVHIGDSCVLMLDSSVACESVLTSEKEAVAEDVDKNIVIKSWWFVCACVHRCCVCSMYVCACVTVLMSWFRRQIFWQNFKCYLIPFWSWLILVDVFKKETLTVDFFPSNLFIFLIYHNISGPTYFSKTFLLFCQKMRSECPVLGDILQALVSPVSQVLKCWDCEAAGLPGPVHKEFTALLSLRLRLSPHVPWEPWADM